MVVLQLADQSVKRPKGVVEDVLVQIDKFYCPVDFLLLAQLILEACKLTLLEVFSNFFKKLFYHEVISSLFCASHLIISHFRSTLNFKGTSTMKVSRSLRDVHVKPFGGCFNSSFGASEYACRDFFLLLGSFLATIACSSSKISTKNFLLSCALHSFRISLVSCFNSSFGTSMLEGRA